MTNEELKTNSEIIEFKIVGLEIISFSEKNYAEYGLKTSDIKGGMCKIGLNFKIDAKKGIIALAILAEFFPGIDNKEFKLISIETVHRFKLKKFKELFKENENDPFILPDNFLIHLLGIALGGTRGMLAASIKITEYKKIVLPLVVTREMFDSYKQAVKTSSK